MDEFCDYKVTLNTVKAIIKERLNDLFSDVGESFDDPTINSDRIAGAIEELNALEHDIDELFHYCQKEKARWMTKA